MFAFWDYLTLVIDDLTKQLFFSSATEVIKTFIATLPILVAAIYYGRVSINNSKKIDSVHQDVNSRMDVALTTQKTLGHAEGMEQERHDERDRQNVQKQVDLAASIIKK